jgi:hypothetical protein
VEGFGGEETGQGSSRQILLFSDSTPCLSSFISLLPPLKYFRLCENSFVFKKKEREVNAHFPHLDVNSHIC